MKNRLIQFIMLSFIVVSLLTMGSMLGAFPHQLHKSYGINSAYADPPWPHGDPDPPGPPWPPGEPDPPGPPWPVPEPSNLALLGTGLALAGGAYGIMRYRNRNKKK